MLGIHIICFLNTQLEDIHTPTRGTLNKVKEGGKRQKEEKSPALGGLRTHDLHYVFYLCATTAAAAINKDLMLKSFSQNRQSGTIEQNLPQPFLKVLF